MITTLSDGGLILKSRHISPRGDLYASVAIPICLLLGISFSLSIAPAWSQTVGGTGGSMYNFHNYGGLGGAPGSDGSQGKMPINQMVPGAGGGGGGAGGGTGGLGVTGDPQSFQGAIGGDGGAGGAHGDVESTVTAGGYNNSGTLQGVAGGAGKRGADSLVTDNASGGGGGGGAGGYGLVVTVGEVINNSGGIRGGDGGAGGDAGSVPGSGYFFGGNTAAGGDGGGGGVGIWMHADGVTVTNSKTITGGTGGKGGESIGGHNSSGGGTGSGGAGGAGIYGAADDNTARNGSVVDNTGTITGGTGGAGGDTDPTLDSQGYGGFDKYGANGGAGGAGVYGVSNLTNQLDASIAGGLGGNAGKGDQSVVTGSQSADEYEANGGGGGAGVVMRPLAGGSAAAVVNYGTITGGNGGTGGDANSNTIYVINQSLGGRGGAGVQADDGGTITNYGTIIGGDGGNGGTTQAPDASNGNGGDGGDGIYGTNLTITNSGVIRPGAGGLAGSGANGVVGYAIHMEGGKSTLTLESGSNIQGKVLAEKSVVQGSGTDSNVFILGGSTNDVFDGTLSSSRDGNAQYEGFSTFIKNGTSTWTLENTYDVDWQIRDGVLEIGDHGALGNGVTIDTGDSANKGFLSYNQSGSTPTTFGGTITGDGGLRKEGTGELVLTGSNTYTGGTELNDGVISVDDEGRLGDLSSGLRFNGGTLKITGTSMNGTDRTITWNVGVFDIDDANNTFTINQDLNGSGALTKEGAGTLVMTGLDSYAGIVQINGGVLQIGDGQTSGTLGTGASVTIASGGSLAFNRSDDALVISQTISGTGGLEQKGSGKTTLIGTNTYTGDTVISAGTLQIGQNGAAGSLDARSHISISGGAKLEISRNDLSPVNFDNAISGDGQVVIDGDGIVSLTNGDNAYKGGTALDAGILVVSSDKVLGSGALTFDGGALRVESSVTMTRDIQVLEPTSGENILDTAQNLTFSGTMTGSNASSFTKIGAGDLLLDQAATTAGFTGTANVDEGVMRVSSAFGGNVNVNSGGALGGTGTVGDTHVYAGGTLAGRFGTTLTISGDLTVETGSIVDVNIGATTFDTGMFNVSGNITLNGKLNVTTGGDAAPGIYRILIIIRSN